MDVGRHPNIRLLAYAEVEKVEGDLGDFHVTVRKKARYVDESKCTGCGACAEKCPTVISDEYNLGLAKAKAIYRYFAQGIPSTYTIDPPIAATSSKARNAVSAPRSARRGHRLRTGGTDLSSPGGGHHSGHRL